MLNRLRAQIRRAILPVADMGLSHQPPGALVFPDDVPPVLAVMAIQDGTTPKLLDKSMFPVPPVFPVGFEIFDAAGNPINAANPLQVTSTPTVDQTNQARVYKSTNTSIPNATVTVITPDTSRYNPGGLWSSGTNPSRLTSKVTGHYLISASVLFAPNGVGGRQVFIRVNGTTDVALQSGNGFVAGDNVYLTVSTLYVLNLNDYVEMYVYQDSGGALNVLQAGNSSPELSMQRVG